MASVALKILARQGIWTHVYQIQKWLKPKMTIQNITSSTD